MSFATVQSGAILVSSCSILTAAWAYQYGHDVEAVAPDAALLAVTENDAYIDSYVYKHPLPLAVPAQQPQRQAELIISRSQIAQALFCCPAFRLERAILGMLGVAPPSCDEFPAAVGELPIGYPIGPWTVTSTIGSSSNNKENSVLLNFPVGHTYVKAAMNADLSELHYTLGSNLLSSSSSSALMVLLIPIHQVYSRVLCKSAALALARALI